MPRSRAEISLWIRGRRRRTSQQDERTGHVHVCGRGFVMSRVRCDVMTWRARMARGAPECAQPRGPRRQQQQHGVAAEERPAARALLPHGCTRASCRVTRRCPSGKPRSRSSAARSFCAAPCCCCSFTALRRRSSVHGNTAPQRVRTTGGAQSAPECCRRGGGARRGHTHSHRHRPQQRQPVLLRPRAILADNPSAFRRPRQRPQ